MLYRIQCPQQLFDKSVLKKLLKTKITDLLNFRVRLFNNIINLGR